MDIESLYKENQTILSTMEMLNTKVTYTGLIIGSIAANNEIELPEFWALLHNHLLNVKKYMITKEPELFTGNKEEKSTNNTKPFCTDWNTLG